MGTGNDKPRITIARPKSKSFEDYKAFIDALTDRLNIGGEPISDERMRESWKKFWGDSATETQNPGSA